VAGVEPAGGRRSPRRGDGLRRHGRGTGGSALRASHRTLPLTKGELEGVLPSPCASAQVVKPPSIPPPRGGKAEMGDALRASTPATQGRFPGQEKWPHPSVLCQWIRSRVRADPGRVDPRSATHDRRPIPAGQRSATHRTNRLIREAPGQDDDPAKTQVPRVSAGRYRGEKTPPIHSHPSIPPKAGSSSPR
jgi:hypothetical protein